MIHLRWGDVPGAIEPPSSRGCPACLVYFQDLPRARRTRAGRSRWRGSRAGALGDRRARPLTRAALAAAAARGGPAAEPLSLESFACTPVASILFAWGGMRRMERRLRGRRHLRTRIGAHADGPCSSVRCMSTRLCAVHGCASTCMHGQPRWKVSSCRLARGKAEWRVWSVLPRK